MDVMPVTDTNKEVGYSAHGLTLMAHRGYCNNQELNNSLTGGTRPRKLAFFCAHRPTHADTNNVPVYAGSRIIEYPSGEYSGAPVSVISSRHLTTVGANLIEKQEVIMTTPTDRTDRCNHSDSKSNQSSYATERKAAFDQSPHDQVSRDLSEDGPVCDCNHQPNSANTERNVLEDLCDGHYQKFPITLSPASNEIIRRASYGIHGIAKLLAGSNTANSIPEEVGLSSCTHECLLDAVIVLSQDIVVIMEENEHSAEDRARYQPEVES